VNEERDSQSCAEESAPSDQTGGTQANIDADANASAEVSETEQLKAEVAALKDEILRTRAAAENLRKRTERDVEAAHKYAVERFANELLPVKDSMEMGLAAALAATDVEGIKQGMDLTLKMLHDFLERMHIRKLDPVGERFNPDFHQAMTMREESGVEPGMVVQVLQSGYLLNDRLLRPALVVVAKAPVDGDG
jgi:molecular chaperone GrpE